MLHCHCIVLVISKSRTNNIYFIFLPKDVSNMLHDSTNVSHCSKDKLSILSIANQPITTFYYFFTYSSQLWIKLDTLFLFGNIDWDTMTMTSQHMRLSAHPSRWLWLHWGSVSSLVSTSGELLQTCGCRYHCRYLV